MPDDITLNFSEKNMRSVAYSLLSTALKYHHPARAPEVAISCSLREDDYVLAVRDNGLGPDVAQDKDKAFGIFKRLHPHVEGSGVGLDMVKKLVENAGGRIEVERELNHGSVFQVYFPAGVPAYLQPGFAPAAPSAKQQSGCFSAGWQPMNPAPVPGWAGGAMPVGAS
ncbi:hypothetical protein LJY25_08460 [Hymenobacter sp. BT175]|uniref:sensor histidine kinase n=1 Tax=Hymenobacter translucens TaxID=2886507 RepID=UPI001D0F3A77|nr:ATP-binding protein [Hymenobacter translucens]MCC2546472.1 hypothetical protein [Hymenobacter translucens]